MLGFMLAIWDFMKSITFFPIFSSCNKLVVIHPGEDCRTGDVHIACLADVEAESEVFWNEGGTALEPLPDNLAKLDVFLYSIILYNFMVLYTILYHIIKYFII